MHDPGWRAQRQDDHVLAAMILQNPPCQQSCPVRVDANCCKRRARCRARRSRGVRRYRDSRRGGEARSQPGTTLKEMTAHRADANVAATRSCEHTAISSGASPLRSHSICSDHPSGSVIAGDATWISVSRPSASLVDQVVASLLAHRPCASAALADTESAGSNVGLFCATPAVAIDPQRQQPSAAMHAAR